PPRNPSGRMKAVRVKTAKARTQSSTRWLERQLNDPYVADAKAKGYRSRAAFKIIEMDDKFHFLRGGARGLDLGAAPSGWSQIAAQRVGARGAVVAVDILDIEPIRNVTILKRDLLAPETHADIVVALGGPADVVMTDMAAATTGHRATDHIRTLSLFEA